VYLNEKRRPWSSSLDASPSVQGRLQRCAGGVDREIVEDGSAISVSPLKL
jgi:hypothetical protein